MVFEAEKVSRCGHVENKRIATTPRVERRRRKMAKPPEVCLRLITISFSNDIMEIHRCSLALLRER